MLATTELPALDDDPFSHEILEDPTDFHHRLREAGPITRLPHYGVYAAGRHAQVHAALTDWQSFESSAGVGLSNFRTETPWRPPSLLLETDPPVHDAPRHVLEPILTPRVLRAMRAEWLRAGEELVEQVISRGEVDLAKDIAAAYPLRVFPDAVGIPREGRENLLPYGDHLFNAFGPKNDLVRKGEPTIAGISAWVNEQCARDKLTPDGFGMQIWEAADRGDILPEQAPTIVRSLLSAGVDTTVHGLAAVLYCFATYPDAWQAVRENPHLIRTAFDEAVRYESPVQTFFRTATRDVELGGTVIGEGEKILLFLGSANRDPRRWDDPDAFDLSRDPSGHVGFGMGIHQCVGQHVARLEAEAILSALATRISRIELTGPPVRHHNNTLRAWESIPARLHA
ncbi:cytochrome P450 [Gordonia amarae]|uniref:Cytochrome P450 n=2 Tax=Gordonia amarae TaxID=36821 RepID=A0A857LKM5_9ACTN|nr:cytochrome P450 [Gordonia amarae]MCS3877863.1 cytochrome P450 [Gordonia amarae]QHN16586.1 cytochrome P450 [Gordonia amarae]QHN21111.1 cytochrome P450 [Gordonia amarae]QHN29964.1 cytochrome P450 [Gordonia amarae]QHN38739.1 cytochrome P450 [Gordonia amarae]